MEIARGDHSCFCLLAPLTYRCCSCRTSRFPFLESVSFVCWRTECEILIVMSPASWFWKLSRNSWNARNVRWNVSHSHSLGCFLICLSRQQCIFKRSAEATFENIFATSDFEFRFYFRQIMCAVSTAGKQHVFLQADLEAASKKSSHLAEALKSVNEELASFKDDWARKVTGMQTAFFDLFCELDSTLLQVTAQRVHMT